MIAQADDLHQSYILHTYFACDSNEDDQCGPTFCETPAGVDVGVDFVFPCHNKNKNKNLT